MRYQCIGRDALKHVGFRKSYKQNLQNLQVFMHNFLYQNILIPSNHILSIHTKIFFTTVNQILFSTNFISKNRFYFFFISSDKHQSPHPVRCHVAGINYLLISFLNAFHCLNLLCQAISPILTSKLTLLRSLLRMPISSLENVILEESLSKRSVPSSVNKAL